MAIASLPLSSSFALAWEHDPAFDRSSETFEHDYGVAVETLDFSKLCKPGLAPTLFHFRPLSGLGARRLIDADMGHMERVSLAFRMGLVRIENGGDGVPALKTVGDAKYGKVVCADLMDFLDELPVAVGARFGDLVTTLGGVVLNRSLNMSPRS